MSQEKCPKCGHYLVAPGATLDAKKKTWKASANAQRFERVGGEGPLVQTWPVPAAKPRYTWVNSRTWERLVQSLIAGAVLLACGLTFSTNPYLGTVACVSSVFFIGSVLFGADNWNVFFRFIDRDRDGRISLDDARQLFEEMFLDDDGSQNVVVHEPPPIIVSDKSGTRTMPAVAPPIIHKVIVRKATRDRKALEIEVGALCEFIRQAVKRDKWGKRDWAGRRVGGVYISQAVWADYRQYFLRGDIGLWELGPQDPPALDKILTNFRLTATNQPKPANQPEAKC